MSRCGSVESVSFSHLCMRILQMFIAENTLYFSAACASGSRVSNFTDSGDRSG